MRISPTIFVKCQQDTTQNAAPVDGYNKALCRFLKSQLDRDNKLTFEQRLVALTQAELREILFNPIQKSYAVITSQGALLEVVKLHLSRYQQDLESRCQSLELELVKGPPKGKHDPHLWNNSVVFPYNKNKYLACLIQFILSKALPSKQMVENCKAIMQNIQTLFAMPQANYTVKYINNIILLFISCLRTYVAESSNIGLSDNVVVKSRINYINCHISFLHQLIQKISEKLTFSDKKLAKYFQATIGNLSELGFVCLDAANEEESRLIVLQAHKILSTNYVITAGHWLRAEKFPLDGIQLVLSYIRQYRQSGDINSLSLEFDDLRVLKEKIKELTIKFKQAIEWLVTLHIFIMKVKGGISPTPSTDELKTRSNRWDESLAAINVEMQRVNTCLTQLTELSANVQARELILDEEANRRANQLIAEVDRKKPKPKSKSRPTVNSRTNLANKSTISVVNKNQPKKDKGKDEKQSSSVDELKKDNVTNGSAALPMIAPSTEQQAENGHADEARSAQVKKEKEKIPVQVSGPAQAEKIAESEKNASTTQPMKITLQEPSAATKTLEKIRRLFSTLKRIDISKYPNNDEFFSALDETYDQISQLSRQIKPAFGVSDSVVQSQFFLMRGFAAMLYGTKWYDVVFNCANGFILTKDFVDIMDRLEYALICYSRVENEHGNTEMNDTLTAYKKLTYEFMVKVTNNIELAVSSVIKNYEKLLVDSESEKNTSQSNTSSTELLLKYQIFVRWFKQKLLSMKNHETDAHFLQRFSELHKQCGNIENLLMFELRKRQEAGENSHDGLPFRSRSPVLFFGEEKDQATATAPTNNNGPISSPCAKNQ